MKVNGSFRARSCTEEGERERERERGREGGREGGRERYLPAMVYLQVVLAGSIQTDTTQSVFSFEY